MSERPDTTNWPPFVQRMLAEHDELADKGRKLETFIQDDPIFETLHEKKKFLLRTQLFTMEQYLIILRERIKIEHKEIQDAEQEAALKEMITGKTARVG